MCVPPQSDEDQIGSGSRVRVKYDGGKRYRTGTIVETVSEGKFNVRYDDGDSECGVSYENTSPIRAMRTTADHFLNLNITCQVISNIIRVVEIFEDKPPTEDHISDKGEIFYIKKSHCHWPTSVVRMQVKGSERWTCALIPLCKRVI